MADEAAELRTEVQTRFERGDLLGALHACRRLLKLCPTDPEVLNDMGAVCFALDRLQESRRYLVEALRLAPGHPDASGNLRQLSRALGLSPEAILAQAAPAAAGEAPVTDISVVVPFRDQFEALQECLGALIGQSFAPARWELVLVANGLAPGGDDRLRNLIESRREALGERVRTVWLDGASIPLARNAGIEEARGRIVLQINADTVLSPTALQRHYAEHDGCAFDPRCVVVGGRRFPELYLSSLFNYLHEAISLYTALHRPRQRFVGDSTWFITCNLSCMREAYARFGTYNPAFPWGSDQELGRRWTNEHGVRVQVNTDIVSYHHHWLSFDQWQRKCIVAVPHWFKRNMGLAIEDLPAEGRAVAQEELAGMQFDPKSLEDEIRRLEAAFTGPEEFRGDVVMGQPVFNARQLAYRMHGLLTDYRKYLKYKEICCRLGDAESNASSSVPALEGGSAIGARAGREMPGGSD